MSESAHHGQGREHEDADAGTEVAAVNSHAKLKRDDARQSSASGRGVRLTDAGPAGDLRLNGEQCCRRQDQPRDQDLERVGRELGQQQRPDDSADDARRRQQCDPVP